MRIARWRRPRWAMVGLLAAALVALGLVGAARADRGGNSAVTALPAGGGAGGVRLRAQTVEVTISEDDKGVWADSRVTIQLSNPFTRAVTLPLALPGPQLTPGDLPANLQVKLGDAAMPLQPAGDGNGLAGQVSLLPQGEAALLITYRQALPETGGQVLYAYPLAATRQWAAAPESLKVTISFATSISPDQVLGVSPDPKSLRGQTYVWSWDSKAGPDIWLAFLAPSWWKQFTAARTAAAAPGAGAAEHVALFRLYQRLSQMPRLPFNQDLDFYSRYYPAAVGELQEATSPQASHGAPSAEEIEAHGLLARLYREQADHLGHGGGEIYVELAAAEAQAALSLGSSDEDLRNLAREAYLELAAEARTAGDMSRADGYLARLAALEPVGAASSAGEEQKAARLALASQQVARGDLDTARAIIRETYGAEAVDIPALRPPLVGQVLVTVDTRVDGRTGTDPGAGGQGSRGAGEQGSAKPSTNRRAGDQGSREAGEQGSAKLNTSRGTEEFLGGQRTVRVTLTDARDPAALRSMLAEVLKAWRPVTQARVTSGADWLAVDFDFMDDQQLVEVQSRLAQLLPALPELALLEATLSQSAIALRAEQDRFQQVWRYSETANLAQAAGAWQDQARQVEAASARLAVPASATPTPGPTPSQPDKTTPSPGARSASRAELGQVQRALWSVNAEQWTTLAGRSYAQYSVQLGGPETLRQWQVPAGARRDLQADDVHWIVERVALVFAGGVVVVLLLAFLLWRLF